MKKIYIFLIGMSLICSLGFSQAVEQGNSIIDGSYGWPNLWTNIFKAAVTSGTSTDIKTGTMGPIALKYEYMVADRIGVGIILNYANSSVKYTEVVEEFNAATQLYETKEYEYKLSVPRYRAMPKFSFHFGNSDVFDGYTSVSVGYGGYSFKYTTDDPNYSDENFDMNIAPIAFRMAIGGRIFFTENIGALMEFGVGGGGLLEFGLAAKF